MTRSQLIREVETDLQAARARAMMRQPMHAGVTYQQVKAERYRKMKVYKTYALALAVLLLVAVAMYAGVMR